MKMRSRALAPAVSLVVLIGLLAACATISTVQSIESLLRQGRELYSAGRYDDAIAKLQEVLRRDPKQWIAYLYLARSYIGNKTWRAAIDSGRKAIELAPREAEVVQVLGEALLGGGLDAVRRAQFSEAIGHLVDYVKLKPTDGSAYLTLGRAYLETGAWADALRSLVQALGQGADRMETLRAMLDGGTRALSRGEARAAVSMLGEYVKHDPQSVSAYVNLGRAYWQAGETQGAFGAFQRVLQLSPGNEEALRFLRGR